MRTPEQFRMALAKHRIHQFELAGHVGIDPNRVGMLLSGRRPITSDLAARMTKALDMIVRDRTEAVAQT